MDEIQKETTAIPKPVKAEIKRDEEGKILPGSASLNPKGRPKGQTLKEYAREYLMSLPDEKKKEYLAQLPPEIVWKMAEGNPHTTNEVENKGTMTQTLLVKIVDANG